MCTANASIFDDRFCPVRSVYRILTTVSIFVWQWQQKISNWSLYYVDSGTQHHILSSLCCRICAGLNGPYGHKGIDMVSNYSGRLWRLNKAQLVLRGPKCAKKISPTPLHHHQQPEPLRQGRMDPSFMFFTLRQILTLPSECRSRNSDSDQATFF